MLLPRAIQTRSCSSLPDHTNAKHTHTYTQHNTTQQELVRQPFKDFLKEQQQLQWQFYLNNRRRFGTPAGGSWEPRLHEPPAAAEGAGAGASKSN